MIFFCLLVSSDEFLKQEILQIRNLILCFHQLVCFRFVIFKVYRNVDSEICEICYTVCVVSQNAYYKIEFQFVPVLIQPACTAPQWRRLSTWKAQSLLSHSITLRRFPSQSQSLCSHFQTPNLLMKGRIFIWNVGWNPWETQPCV